MNQVIHNLFFSAILLCGAGASIAGDLNIAAASDLQFAMGEIVGKFKVEHPHDNVKAIFGSSGKFAAQIRNDAPFDVYFSADILYPQQLRAEGLAVTEPRIYATGRIAVWSLAADAPQLTLEQLNDPRIRKIAIADPAHAPYGQRAKEALRAAGVWEKIQGKLVFGENISHTAQMVQSGAAEAGIVALSLVKNPELARQGGYTLIDDKLHSPLAQAFVITRRAKDNKLAYAFAEYMQKPEALIIMERYGFMLPKK